jgi:DNA repair protein SbcD/Mre11
MNQKISPLKMLHTSDWHIGRTLYGRKRYEQFEAFLTWVEDFTEHNLLEMMRSFTR